MLISHNWLKKYFKEGELPDVKTIENTFTMGVFEIDAMDSISSGGLSDTIFDVKVLPDRSHYCFSHRYVAQELGALLNVKANLPTYDSSKINIYATVDSVIVNVSENKIEDRYLCSRYIARKIEGVEAGPSPLWLKEQLEVLGQRSINTIVDLTNYIMLETGQPLHAFDADKVKGGINVRFANEGEMITLLDGSEVTLSSDILVIADDEGALAIAGVKGGKKAEVTADTKNIIIESANFDSVSVRRTSQKVGIKNESSKRFENKVTQERALLAMNAISEHLSSIFPNAKFGNLTDVFRKIDKKDSLTVSVDFINESLGSSSKISGDDIKNILSRCDINSEVSGDSILIHVPEYRLDLNIALDIVDEVGRILNYANLAPVEIPHQDERPILKNFYYMNLFRVVFKQINFSEVYTHTLKKSGDYEIQNPLNIERGFMRNNLTDTLMVNLENNLRYAESLGLDSIKIFEMGNIFGGKKERLSIAFGVANAKKIKGYSFDTELESILNSICSNEKLSALTVDKIKSLYSVREENIGRGGVNVVANVCEIELQKLIDLLPDPKEDIFFETPKLIKYKKISQYPYMTRDIAVFVPGESDSKEVYLNMAQSYLEVLDCLMCS